MKWGQCSSASCEMGFVSLCPRHWLTGRKTPIYLLTSGAPGTGWLGVKHQFTYFLCPRHWLTGRKTPIYLLTSCVPGTGWLGVKHQFTYLIPVSQDPSLRYGWRTGAIIPELEVSLLASMYLHTVFCWLQTILFSAAVWSQFCLLPWLWYIIWMVWHWLHWKYEWCAIGCTESMSVISLFFVWRFMKLPS